MQINLKKEHVIGASIVGLATIVAGATLFFNLNQDSILQQNTVIEAPSYEIINPVAWYDVNGSGKQDAFIEKIVRNDSTNIAQLYLLENKYLRFRGKNWTVINPHIDKFITSLYPPPEDGERKYSIGKFDGNPGLDLRVTDYNERKEILISVVFPGILPDPKLQNPLYKRQIQPPKQNFKIASFKPAYFLMNFSAAEFMQ